MSDLKQMAMDDYKQKQAELKKAQDRVKELKKEILPMRRWLEAMGALEPAARKRK